MLTKMTDARHGEQGRKNLTSGDPKIGLTAKAGKI